MKIDRISKNGKDIILQKIDNGCVICTSHCKDSDGYIRIRYKGKHSRLHRVLYEMKFGEIPKGMVIRHKCDNPNCCNIEHLEIGTQKDNVEDMIKRGRSSKGKPNINARGMLNSQSKLTTKQVREIYLSPLKQKELGKIYGVSNTNINYIKNKKQWAWLTDKIDEELKSS